MKIRSIIAKPLANCIVGQRKKWEENAVDTQMRWLHYLLDAAKHTAFGKEHRFSQITNYQDFKVAIPIRDYEDFRPYMDKVLAGERDILWQGLPAYFAKTSGTTSGTKYIPLSHESVPFHISAARDALLSYIYETGKAGFLDKKLIFLSGSPALSYTSGIATGRLSGIVNHHVPAYLRGNQLPNYATNCIDDWETKLDKIIDETVGEDMSLISGIPPWVQMYFDRIQEQTGKAIKDVFPHFSLFIYGGVNFEPYRAKLFDSIGKPIDSIETYPTSEGFIAYQDSQDAEGLLLLLNHGIFFEFIIADEFFNETPQRLHIGEVKLGINYALIINSNAGLWGYSIGDTIRFVSLHPYRIVVTGRIKHFISAFGEHVIGEEVEKALRYAMSCQPETEVVEFTVAPMVAPAKSELPYHEWLIEFANQPKNLATFAANLNQKMRELNVYYDDLVVGNILRPLKISSLKRGSFVDYMKKEGKLGGQNKVPRLANDRKIADALIHINT